MMVQRVACTVELLNEAVGCNKSVLWKQRKCNVKSTVLISEHRVKETLGIRAGVRSQGWGYESRREIVCNMHTISAKEEVD
ncbi:hypothetical protein QVD17_17189 [Tagetes erecta]|uniref:Uncharacterized protein n=1 Tax=Tagetes erecta TaxID=13708 RepID=A0AAD8P173_TARER|nr:hypothetical protein QVD17_17189 [Tagetes erecta]